MTWINEETYVFPDITEQTISSVNNKMVKSLDNVREEPLKRINSGLDGIDYLYGHNGSVWGLPRGTISLWAGEKGVGKSRVAIHLAKNLVKNGKKVLYIQGEVNMSSFKNWVEKGNNNSIPLHNFYVSEERGLKEQ